MTDSFYVFADCASLGGGCLGRKFGTQEDMDCFLNAKGRCSESNKSNNTLPLYTPCTNIHMELDQLYTTQLSQNEYCCLFYALKTQKESVEQSHNLYNVPVNPEMWDKVYEK